MHLYLNILIVSSLYNKQVTLVIVQVHHTPDTFSFIRREILLTLFWTALRTPDQYFPKHIEKRARFE